MQDILRIVVQVPPPPYEGEEAPPPPAAPSVAVPYYEIGRASCRERV